MRTAMPPSEKIAFSIFHSTGAPLSKSFRLSPARKLIKETGGRLLRGKMQTIHAPDMQTIADYLDGLTAQDAVTWGVSKHNRAHILPERQVAQGVTVGNNGVPTIARTRKYFNYPAGPGVMMLDYDPPAGDTPLSIEELLTCLYKIWPALAEAPIIVRASASAYICHGNKTLRGAKGIRVLVAVQDATDIPRAGAVLNERAWLSGYGRIEISKAGSLLERTIVDATVWQPERLDFCGPASVYPPLAQHKPDTMTVRNSALLIDTAATVLALLAPEKRQRKAVITAAKAISAVAGAEIHTAWLEARVGAGLAKLPAETTPTERKKHARIFRETYEFAAQKGLLRSDYLLHLANGNTVTVADILDNPDQHDYARCADPLEPSYRNDGRVAFIRTCNPPFIYSNAHGGIRYSLLSSSPIIDEDEEITEINKPTTTELSATQSAYCTDSNEMTAWLDTIQPGDIAELHAPTGVGKSYFLRKYAIDLVQRGEGVLYLCDSLQSMYRTGGFIAAQAEDCLRVPVISYLARSEDYNRHADIIIGTFGVLGRKDESTGGFASLHEAVSDRYVIADEAQELYALKMRQSIPLCARYMLRSRGRGQDRWVIQRHCPQHSRKGTCDNCRIAFPRGDNRPGQGSAFDSRFSAEMLDVHQSAPDWLPAPVLELLDPNNYNHAISTTYIRKVEQNCVIPDILIGDQANNTFSAYLQSIAACLVNFQLRMQIPTSALPDNPEPHRFTNPLHPLTSKPGEAQTPVAPCNIPTITGVDLYPLLQLFPSRLTYQKAAIADGEEATTTKDYPGAKTIILATATPEKRLSETLEALASKHERVYKTYENNHPLPYSFDVTVLRTATTLSDKRLREIAQAVMETEVKALVVYKDKVSAKAGYNTINTGTCTRQRARLFYERDFSTAADQRSEEDWGVICTYPRAAITKGGDFPSICLIIINCQALLPTMALDSLAPGMSREEVNAALLADLQQVERQLDGRLFRSLLSRKPGETVPDPRKIVVVFHSLPDFAMELDVDRTLCHSYRTYSTWLSRSDTAKSAIDSIKRALQGAVPQNWEEIDKEKVARKFRNKGLRGMSRRQRAAVKPLRDKERTVRKETKAKTKAEKMSAAKLQHDKERADRAEKKLREKVEEVKTFLLTTGNERQAANHFHLHRLTKKDWKIFWKRVQGDNMPGRS